MTEDRASLAAASDAAHAAGQVSKRLEAARQVIERRFSDAGGKLEAALNVVGRLVEGLEELDRSVEGGAMEDMAGQLVAAAGELNALPRLRADRREHLVALRGVVVALQRQVAEMRQALQYLGVYTLNIKMAAAASVRSAEAFAGFAEEMHGRIQTAADEIGGFSAEIDALDAHLVVGLESEARLETAFSEVLPTVPDRLGVDAAAVAAHHRRVGETSAEVARIARGIQMKVAGALSALQIGDTTRQRIEHVQAGLTLMAETRFASDPHRRRMLRMLADQMADLAGEFAVQAARMGEGLGGVALDTQRILELQQSLSGRRGETGGLRGLEASVGRAIGLIDQVRAGARTADDLGASARRTVEGLSRRVGTVKSVREDIQRIALNASLRCSRLGDIGRPLNVIAFELDYQANQLGRTSTASLASLQEIAEAAGRLGEAPAAGGQGGDADSGEKLSGALAGLKRAADLVEGELAASLAQGAEASTALSRSAAGLDLKREIGALLDEAAQALGQAAGSDDAPLAACPAFEAAMGRLFALYTMARERTVHARHHQPAAEAGEAEDAGAALF